MCYCARTITLHGCILPTDHVWRHHCPEETWLLNKCPVFWLSQTDLPIQAMLTWPRNSILHCSTEPLWRYLSSSKYVQWQNRCWATIQCYPKFSVSHDDHMTIHYKITLWWYLGWASSPGPDEFMTASRTIVSKYNIHDTIISFIVWILLKELIIFYSFWQKSSFIYSINIALIIFSTI